MPETVRFAPSPTGEIHIGNVRTALFNWFLAIRTGGAFILRYDDTDKERSEERFAKQIAADLEWLGIAPHRVERQSERLEIYDAAAKTLREAGLLYPCYETPQELDRKRGRQRARGLPPIYDRAALDLTDEDRDALEAEGRRPHYRFKLPGGSVEFLDLCRGPQTVNLGTLSDPILVREDGSYLYTLPSVVDDADMGVSTVVRGEDHITNTGVQIALFKALGSTPPAFAHHNLLTRSDGEPLSKRDNPLSIARLSADGYEPMAVASLAVLTGTSRPVAPEENLELLSQKVDLSDVSRGPATFDPAELTRLNAAIVHDLPSAAVRETLGDLPFDVEAFWTAVRGNIQFRKDAADWAWRASAPAAELLNTVAFDDAERGVVTAASAALKTAPWDDAVFKTLTQSAKEATGAKGKALFMPLRKALTGLEAGPEMGPWLKLIGESRTRARLDAASG